MRRAGFKKAILSGAMAQVLGNVLNIIYIPLALAHLGTVAFGAWMVIMSIVMYLGLSQFGLGSATAALIAKTSEEAAQRDILSASVRYLCIAGGLSLGIVGAAMVGHGLWQGLFGNISAEVASEAVMAAGVMAFLYVLRLPTMSFPAAFVGMQEVHWERVYSAILPPFAALLALLATRTVNGDLVILAIYTGVAQLVVGLASGLHLLSRHASLRFKVSQWWRSNRPHHDILTSGGRFFVVSLAALVVWGTDNLLISYFIGVEAVTPYAITFKLFAAAFAIFIIINSALWPMFGRAAGENDWLWVSTTYRMAVALLPVLGGLVWLGGILFAETIIELWTGSEGYAGALVVFALGGYGYVLALINTHATLLGGMNETRGMLWVGVAEALANLFLSIMLLQWFGIGGVALGTLLAALLTAFWLLPLDIRHRTNNQVQMNWGPFVRHLFVMAPLLVLAHLLGVVQSGLSYFLLAGLLLIVYAALCWVSMDAALRGYLRSLVASRRRATGQPTS